MLFGEIESISPPRAPTVMLNGEMKGGLPIEAFSRVQELFSGVELIDSGDDAAFWLLKEISANALQERIQKLILSDVKELTKLQSKVGMQMSLISPTDSDEEKDSATSNSVSSVDNETAHHSPNITTESEEMHDDSAIEDSDSIGKDNWHSFVTL